MKGSRIWVLAIAAAYPIIAGAAAIVIDKLELQLWLNQYHHPWLDVFFPILTHLGDGLFAMACAVVLSYFSYRKATMVLAAFLFSGAVVQLLKHFAFPEAMRPYHYFAETAGYHLVAGTEGASRHSFPSGHSATAFALASSLVFTAHRLWKWGLFMVLAAMVALSRVYLSAHFLGDTAAGASIGVLSVFPTALLIAKVPMPEKGWGGFSSL